MVRKLLLGVGAIALGFAALSSGSGPVEAATTPPNCAAIAFRPMLVRQGDGEQDVGLYKSRFGRIEVKATVKDGQTANYFVEINGKPLAAVTDKLPPAVAACAKAKRLTAPSTPDPACTGDQLQVLIEHSGDTRYFVLYAHRTGAWHFCSAGTA